LNNMQNEDGSWTEICNMQGFSNVWATGFIGLFLNKESNTLKKANKFLIQNKQDNLWGYNTDWTYDYDSTTCVLGALNFGNYNIKQYMDKWWEGQGENGAFTTYTPTNKIISMLNLNKKEIKGWTQGHTCVSAMSYYFLANSEVSTSYKNHFELIYRQ